MLNPNYLNDGRWHYELREQWAYDFGELLTKLLANDLVASLDLQTAGDVTRLVSLVRTRLSAAIPQ
jgi:hypothetical protein